MVTATIVAVNNDFNVKMNEVFVVIVLVII